jgi:hypothetical protein
MATKSGVYGIRELALAFRRVGLQPMGPERRAAREYALEPVLDAARQNLMLNDSVETEALMESLAVGPHAEREAASVVGPRKGKFKKGRTPASYSHLVEFSVAPHWQPRRRRMHPGHPGYPFLRPAWDENKDEVTKRYFAKMTMAIEALARRYYARRRP